VNRFLKVMLRPFVSPTQNDWDEQWPAAESAVKNAWHGPKQNSPFFSNSDYHPRTSSAAQIDSLVPEGLDVPCAKNFLEEINRTVAEVKQALQNAQQRQKASADTKRWDVHYEVGQELELLLSTRNMRFKGPGTKKLISRWAGPYRVKRKIGKVAATMRLHPLFHVSLLKPYYCDEEKIFKPLSDPFLVDGQLYFRR